MQDLSLPDELVAVSAAMRAVLARVHLLAADDEPVLLVGERGTGKEAVARLLHRLSARADQPLVVVDGADPLHTPGLNTALEGVLVLKEPAGLAPAVQDALAAAICADPTPTGSTEPPAGMRVLATCAELSTLQAPGLRPDLAARLGSRVLCLPPLRERLADILPLAEHLLQRAAGDAPPKTLARAAALRLLEHTWPGNVDELRKALVACHARVRHAVIGAHDLPLSGDSATPAPTEWPTDWIETPLPAATERLERTLIVHTLSVTAGNRAEAARRLGIHRQLLYRKLALYGLG